MLTDHFLMNSKIACNRTVLFSEGPSGSLLHLKSIDLSTGNACPMEIDWEDRSERFQVLKIEAPDTLSQERLDALPLDWPMISALPTAWAISGFSEERSLLLAVPSVLLPETRNVLMNPRHME